MGQPEAPEVGGSAAGWILATVATAPDAVYVDWLRLQCELIGGATAAVLVLQQPDRPTYRTAAAWPATLMDVSALIKVAEQALNERATVVAADRAVVGAPSVPVRPRILFGQPIGATDRALPIGAVVLAVDERAADLAMQPAIARQLHWGSGWIEAMEWRRQSEEQAGAARRLAEALDAVAVCGEHRRIGKSALAVANELSVRFGCSRVAIGRVQGDDIRLVGLSHSATFDRRSRLVGGIENAMAETLHQNGTVLVPAPSGAPSRVDIAHRELLKRSNAQVAASFILQGRSGASGILTLEREGEEPFGAADVRMLEMAAGLLGPIFELQIERERWFAGRAPALVTALRDRLFGPDHPTFKFVAAVVAVLLVLSLLVPATFRVSAKAAVEGEVRRNLVAPFDGYIATARARPGDIVAAGTMLAQLDDRDALLEQARFASERQTLAARYSDAIARHDRAALTILAAQIEQVSAQLALAQEKLGRTRIVAPFRGIVTSGDLSQALGSPVERGKLLFEMAPLERYRVVVQVDERDVRYVAPGDPGQIVLAGMPSERLPFTVSRVTPLATAADGRNAFRVEATLRRRDARLRPGMEGIARIEVGTRPLLWTWSRSLIDWVRITLWKWLP